MHHAVNRTFHEQIFRVNGNAVPTEIHGGLNYHVLIEQVFHSQGVTDVPEVIAEHQADLDALDAHDPAAAEEAMRPHVERGSLRILELQDAKLHGLMPARHGQH
ncbi:MAG: FCD domain-containing protein, partial [Chloroflexota bacterium]